MELKLRRDSGRDDLDKAGSEARHHRRREVVAYLCAAACLPSLVPGVAQAFNLKPSGPKSVPELTYKAGSINGGDELVADAAAGSEMGGSAQAATVVVDCGEIPTPPGCHGGQFSPRQPELGALVNPEVVTPNRGLTNQNVKDCQGLAASMTRGHIGDGAVYKVTTSGGGTRTIRIKAGLADMQQHEGPMKSNSNQLLFANSCAAAIDSRASFSIVSKTKKGGTKTIKKLAKNVHLSRSQEGYKGFRYLGQMFGFKSVTEFDPSGLDNKDLAWKRWTARLASRATRNYRLRVKVTSIPKIHLTRAQVAEQYPDVVTTADYPNSVSTKTTTRDYAIKR